MSAPASPLSLASLKILSEIRILGRQEEWPIAGDTPWNKKSQSALLNRDLVRTDGAGYLHVSDAGVEYLRGNWQLLTVGYTTEQMQELEEMLGFGPKDKSAKARRDKRRLIAEKLVEELKAERDELKAAAEKLTTERDDLKRALENVTKGCEEASKVHEREIANLHKDRDHNRSQLIYAHRLAATGAKLDDIEKMRVVFGLIVSETKPLENNPLPAWWAMGILGSVVGAYAMGAHALGGVKK